MMIQIFTLLVAAMLFNSMEGNWITKRVETMRYARRLYASGVPDALDSFLSDSVATPLPLPDFKVRALAKTWVKPLTGHAAADTMSPYYGLMVNDGFATPRGDRDSLQYRFDEWQNNLYAAAELILGNGYTVSDLDDMGTLLRQHLVRNVLSFPIPVINVRLDINGLGVYADLGLCLLVTWLALSINRERRNLPVLRAHHGEAAVDVVRMETLFFPQDTLGGSRRTSKLYRAFLRYVPPWASLLLPFALLAFVWKNDRDTAYKGKWTNVVLTEHTLSFEIVLFAVLGILISWCLVEHEKLNAEAQRRVVLPAGNGAGIVASERENMAV